MDKDVPVSLDKDPLAFGLLTYAWVLVLSVWGGAVAYLGRLRDRSLSFRVMEFIGEIFTSGFAGILTFWLAEAAGINSLVTAALVGVSGHMGSRAIHALEDYYQNRLLPKRGDL